MKLIIDIPEMAYETYKEWHKNKVATVEQSIIANGKPYEETPQGEWIDVNGDGSLWKCDNCGENSCCKGNYCPDCGASMKGGAENDRQRGKNHDI